MDSPSTLLSLHSTLLALSVSVRLKVLDQLLLQQQPMTPSLLSSLCSLPLNTISHHLNILEDHNLVQSLKSGHNMLYFPNRKRFEQLSTAFKELSNASNQT
jgi:predicted transcriptional regulator